MKKLFYLIASSLVVANMLTACEDDVAKNPGDFNLKPTLEISEVITSLNSGDFQLKKQRETDTTYRYFYLKEDTLRDADGNFVIDSRGNMVVKTDTVYYNSKITARLTEYELVMLPAPADTFSISLKSNAKWNAPLPPKVDGKEVNWYYNYNNWVGGSLTTGGGDGEVGFRVSRNRNKTRATVAVQDIMTADSTVLIRLRFCQKGEKDEE